MFKKFSSKTQETIVGFAFLSPFMIGYTIFVIIPVLYTAFLSVMDFDNIGKMSNLKFVGLRNFIELFKDQAAMGSYFKSIEYSLVYVPCMLIFSLFMASLMNKNFKLKRLSRTLIFMPYVANVTAIAIVFNVILNPFDGPVNKILRAIGMKNPPQWLLDSTMALPVSALIAVWANMTFQTILFLAAMQDVPKEMYEAADLEGASAWTKLTKLTLPWISPTTFFLVVTTIIGSTQNFSNLYTLTKGGPGGATEVAMLSIYKNSFEFNKFSFASAQTIVLFGVLLVITIVQWRGQKKWVHY
ncbi:sugar ABC transporter permease [Clostridium estertheticum]|uniref:carbohydrate ABC transporter permease n=1 Tax=Clostridium estertheticum TaxID=238834 RepID=UPI001C0AA30D|nr:sugar ABC transporter permease [Clostridium estertheticum]MBU3199936.1 sugar ABC transporter permease [Clostridium estertheticum]WAG66966.1 sugar ABC transporter permease [Clostridium estertheticum]